VWASSQRSTSLSCPARHLHELPDGELRDEIRAALAASEQGFIERVAFAWEVITASGRPCHDPHGPARP
jgi:hypothetical protein